MCTVCIHRSQRLSTCSNSTPLYSSGQNYITYIYAYKTVIYTFRHRLHSHSSSNVSVRLSTAIQLTQLAIAGAWDFLHGKPLQRAWGAVEHSSAYRWSTCKLCSTPKPAGLATTTSEISGRTLADLQTVARFCSTVNLLKPESSAFAVCNTMGRV